MAVTSSAECDEVRELTHEQVASLQFFLQFSLAFVISSSGLSWPKADRTSRNAINYVRVLKTVKRAVACATRMLEWFGWRDSAADCIESFKSIRAECDITFHGLLLGYRRIRPLSGF